MRLSEPEARGPEEHERMRRGLPRRWRSALRQDKFPAVLIIACLVFGFGGAVVGWWKDTRILYRRPGSKWATDILPKERIHSTVLARRRRKRLLSTAEFGAYGAVLGAAIFWTLQPYMQ